MAAIAGADPNPNAPIDRPHTLRLVEPPLLEAAQDRLIAEGKPLSFIFPRPCRDRLDTLPGCPGTWRLGIRDTARAEELGFRFLLAQEYREATHARMATEGGAVVAGGKGPLSFDLDARMFMERREDGDRGSTDGEIMDFQDEGTSGTAYVSYSRYRGGMALDLPVGRFTASRDAVHWGPGLFTNLAFHHAAVPFHQFAYSAHLGPFAITSLYGDLQVGTDQATGGGKHLFAHRYEWRIGADAVLGFSEQLILDGDGKPYLFVPIYPLFIAKGFLEEGANNGNLAVDASYRLGRYALLYTEFFLDDLESPGTLFTEDYRQNKWAWRAGGHVTSRWRGLEPGAILEYSRVEPWVYTHFEDSDAEAANLGAPLGNPFGPNSQYLVLRLYSRFPRGLYASFTASALWKGRDPGSIIFDPFERARFLEKKSFLADAEAQYYFTPEILYRWRFLGLLARVQAGEHFALLFRVQAQY